MFGRKQLQSIDCLINTIERYTTNVVVSLKITFERENYTKRDEERY